jgi:hypothetical protein
VSALRELILFAFGPAGCLPIAIALQWPVISTLIAGRFAFTTGFCAASRQTQFVRSGPNLL